MNKIPQCENNFNNYPQFICHECGMKLTENQRHLFPKDHISSYSIATCGWCLKQKEANNPSSWGFPDYDYEIIMKIYSSALNPEDE